MWNYISSALTGKYEQPPYPCASPLKKVDIGNANACEQLADEVHTSVSSLIRDPSWKLLDYVDPESKEGGDLKLFSRHSIGTFHFIKACMSLQNTTPEKIIETLHSETLEGRQKFSADLINFRQIAKPTQTTNVQFLEYWAPPPVAGRDFCFLASQREGDGGIYVVGCSINCEEAPKGNYVKLVRGSSMWGWHVLPVGEHCLVTYVNCFDPKGWAPRFLIAWLKTSVANELVAARSLLYGKKVTLVKANLGDCGVSEDDIKKEITEHEAAH